MSKVNDAMRQLHTVDALAGRNTFLAGVHPAGKLLVTVLYLTALLSFSVQNFTGVLSMLIYIIIVYQLGELSFGNTVKRLWGLFLLLLLVGIADPFLNQTVITYWGTVPVTAGMLSFCTLFLKGGMALLAAYGLMASTGMDSLCYGLQCLHLPGMLIVVIMLIYRYSMLFLKEVDRRTLAYSMRAPGHRGVHFPAWGSLLGGMLLGSIDRAELVYESMQLRGFQGEFQMVYSDRYDKGRTIGYCLTMTMLILLLRLVPVFELVGGLLF